LVGTTLILGLLGLVTAPVLGLIIGIGIFGMLGVVAILYKRFDYSLQSEAFAAVSDIAIKHPEDSELNRLVEINSNRKKSVAKMVQQIADEFAIKNHLNKPEKERLYQRIKSVAIGKAKDVWQKRWPLVGGVPILEKIVSGLFYAMGGLMDLTTLASIAIKAVVNSVVDQMVSFLKVGQALRGEAFAETLDIQKDAEVAFQNRVSSYKKPKVA
jgi:hypothetical protein